MILRDPEHEKQLIYYILAFFMFLMVLLFFIFGW